MRPVPDGGGGPKVKNLQSNETQFVDLPISEFGNVQAQEERWAAAESLAQALGDQRDAQAQADAYASGGSLDLAMGNPSSARALPLGGGPEAVGYDPEVDARVRAARKRLDEANATVATWSDRFSRPLDSYPTLAKAVANAPDLNVADTIRLRNVAAAWTAADAILANKSPQGQLNILAMLPPAQRLMVLDICNERYTMQQFGDAYSSPEVIGMRDQADRRTWGPLRVQTQGTAEDVLTGVNTFYDTVNHAARAALYGMQENRYAPVGSVRPLVDPFLFWDETADGTFNQAVVDEARAQYGDAPVDVIMEMMKLKGEGDPSPIITVAAKYFDDPEKAAVIDALTQRVIDDPDAEAYSNDILALADKLGSASTSDFGQMYTTWNWLTNQPLPFDASWRGSTAQQMSSGATNVVTTFLFDPLIIGGKVRGTYLAARYGLSRLSADAGTRGMRAAGASLDELTAANAAAVADAVNNPAVREYISEMTKDLLKYNEARLAGQDVSNMGQALARRYKNYFPEDTLVAMAEQGVHSPEAFIKFVQDSNAALLIERGEIAALDLPADEMARRLAALEENSLFGRMSRQQGSSRGTPLLPRASLLGSVARHRLVDLFVGAKPGTPASKAVKQFYEQANDPDVSAGGILFGQAEDVATFDKSVSTPWDKVSRLLATTAGRPVIYTLDARDTQIFYKFARIFLSKPHAQYLAEQWRHAPQSQRILMWTGIVRTAAARRGAMEIAERPVKLKTSLVNGKRNVTVGEITNSLNFSDNPQNLFSVESGVINFPDGSTESVDSFINRQVDDYIAFRKASDPNAPIDENEIAAFRAGLIATNPDGAQVADALVRTSPSNFDGRQLPVHLWQTSDYLHVPNMSEIALITKRSKLMNQLLGLTPGSFASEAVNWWSLLNLVGFRYSVRNAIEDYSLYALTGGYFMDAVKGRVMSTAARETRGQNIGWFARKMRRASGEAQPGGEPYNFWQHVILPQLNKEEVRLANEAMANGELEPIRNLMVTAAIRQKLGRLLTSEEERYVAEYITSDAAFTQVDELTELARHLNLGTAPGSESGGVGSLITDGRVVYPRGSYTEIDMASKNPLRFTYWHNALHGVLERDGSIGTIAVKFLDDPEQAIREVAKAIDADTRYGYKERLAAFYEVNTSTNEFARRYVQDVLNIFTSRDGQFNTSLWRKFVSGNGDSRLVTWADRTDEGVIPRVTVKSLSETPKDMLPHYVLGRETADEALVLPTTISERIWNSMGNAFVRISKEPIYFANYLSARRNLVPYETELAEAVGPEAAGIAASKIATDRAYALTLSFTDNPANQSMLAWRMRNFARYYRATEDFYRRVYRMAKFEPMGIYKAYLAIGVLDESGFVHEDEFGDKYFLYPGGELINGIVGRALSLGGEQSDGMFTSAAPLIFGGKVKMLAPSFDPVSAVPSLSSGLAALSVSTVVKVVPQLQQYEEWVAGRYGADQAILQSAMPAVVRRGLDLLSQDERNSAYASAYISAAQVATGAGLMPGPMATDKEKGEAARGLAGLTVQILASRFGLGFIYPASPQVMQNDVTTFARRMGTSSMTQVYRGLVREETKAGSPDPYASALMKGVAIYGLDFTAYSVPKSGQGEDLKSVPEYSYGQEVQSFVKSNEQLISDHPSMSMFLAPVRTDETKYDANTRKWLIKNGYRTTPTISNFMDRLNGAEANYVYNVTMDDADAAIAAAKTPQQKEAAEADKAADKARVYAAYPELEDGRAMQSRVADWLGKLDRTLNGPDGVRPMLDDFYAGKYGPVPESVNKIAEAVATYDYYEAAISEIPGSTKAEDERKKRLRLDRLTALRDIADEDPNGEMFIRRVLYPLLQADADGNPRG